VSTIRIGLGNQFARQQRQSGFDYIAGQLLLLLLAVVVDDDDGVRTNPSHSASCQCDRFARNSWRLWTGEVLQWYRKFPVVPVQCHGSPASVPASAVPGHILGSWGQLCRPPRQQLLLLLRCCHRCGG